MDQDVNLSLRLNDHSDAQLPQNTSIITSSTGLEASPIQISENTSAGMQELLPAVDIRTQQRISQYENNRSGYFREHLHDINNEPIASRGEQVVPAQSMMGSETTLGSLFDHAASNIRTLRSKGFSDSNEGMIALLVAFILAYKVC